MSRHQIAENNHSHIGLSLKTDTKSLENGQSSNTLEQQKIREISGSHGGEYEDGWLLGCCTV
jgi:hypothetical protein